MEKGRIGSTRLFPHLSGKGRPRQSCPPLLDQQDRISRSNPRQAPSRFVITIKMSSSGTGPSFTVLIQANRFRAEDEDDQANRHRQECNGRIPPAISEGRWCLVGRGRHCWWPRRK